MKKLFYRLNVALILFMLLAGCAVNPVSGKQDFVLMSEAEELSLGSKHSRQVMKQYRRYDNEPLQQYIQALGSKLAKQSHRQGLVYRFTLLDSAEVNAFALPGGYIYITRGLLAYLNSEAELAAVLGHEIGHVTARHSVRQHSASTATNLLGSLLAVASGVQGASQLSNMLGTGFIRGYGREHELEADRLGVEYLARTGYSPMAMKKVISTLKNQEVFDKKQAREQARKPRAYHGVFATHPKHDRRLIEVLSSANHLVTKPASKAGQDRAFLKRLNGLTYGDSTIDGIVRDNVFYHLGMDFKLGFPKNWLIQNTLSAVAAQAPAGKAMIKMTVEDLHKVLTPRQFLTQRLGVRQFVTEQALQISGFEAYTGVLLGGAQGKSKLRLAVIYVAQRAFIFMAGVRSNNDFAAFDQVMLESIRSFSRLRREDKKIAKELKLEIKQKRSSDSLLGLAKKSPLGRDAEDKIRLLNAVFPKGKIKQGDLIKIVR